MPDFKASASSASREMSTIAAEALFGRVVVNETEREPFETLSKAWGVQARPKLLKLATLFAMAEPEIAVTHKSIAANATKTIL